MRKVSRGGNTRKRSTGGDRTTKPGFRPKGNNTAPRSPRKRISEGDGEASPRSRRTTDRSERPAGPRSFSERSERPSRTSTSRTERPERSSRYERGDRDERPSRTSTSRTERPERSSRYERGDRDERPARTSTSRTERPERSSRYERGDRDERPSRTSTTRTERPERPSRYERGDRDERPSRTSTARTERPERSSRYERGDRDERPSRTSTSRTERPERSSRYERGDRDERPSRTSTSRTERPERSSRYERGDQDERPARSSSGTDRPAGKSTYDPADRGPRSRGTREERPFSSDRRRSTDSERPTRRREEGDDRRGRKPEGGRFTKGKPAFRKPRTPEKSVLSDDGTTRLNKYISNCGICSRREADELIKVGLVTVNGKIITEMGFKVQQGDEVRYNNELLRGERPVYVLLNKPKDYITTVDDPGNRHTVMELVANACKERIYPVGRLDRNTTGVLLFTNDGELARKLMHPSFEVQKVYHVSLDKNLQPDNMDKILEGIRLEDGPIKVDDIAYAGDGGDRKEVGIELHSGRNRIVRRIFEHFGHEIMKLDRTVFAGLTKKDLPRGRWRFLTELEVANLKMLVGDRRFREAMRDEQ